MSFSKQFFKSLTEDELGMLQYILSSANPNLDLDMLCSCKHHIICDRVVKAKDKLKKDDAEASEVYKSLCNKLGINISK